MTKKADDDRIERAIDRRNAIRKIIKTKGFKSVSELGKILKEDYGISVVRQTLYSDMAGINAVTKEEKDEFENKIIISCELYLKELDNIIMKTKDDKIKMQAIRTYFTCSKEMGAIVTALTPAPPPVHVTNKKEDINVSFTDR